MGRTKKIFNEIREDSITPDDVTWIKKQEDLYREKYLNHFTNLILSGKREIRRASIVARCIKLNNKQHD